MGIFYKKVTKMVYKYFTKEVSRQYSDVLGQKWDVIIGRNLPKYVTKVGYSLMYSDDINDGFAIIFESDIAKIRFNILKRMQSKDATSILLQCKKTRHIVHTGAYNTTIYWENGSTASFTLPNNVWINLLNDLEDDAKDLNEAYAKDPWMKLYPY